ncbi:MAG TPA: hypothetical protein VK422_05950 [Pyrinomonadaceae bacterium]|nr:hypothetical protein [Pyrinomonadaceae bacterium]
MTQALLTDARGARVTFTRPPVDAAELYDGDERGHDAVGVRLGLLALVPLVRVAWAEGRVTRRERELITRAARRLGVEEGGAADLLLSGWLKARPGEEFFDGAFAHLRSLLHDMPGDDGEELTLDLLRLCTLVAQVSGGNASFAAGGSLICGEEIKSVKSVAAELRPHARGASVPPHNPVRLVAGPYGVAA